MKETITATQQEHSGPGLLSSRGLTRRLVLGLLLGFLVLLALVLIGDIRQVSRLVLNFRWSLLPFILALTLFNYTLRYFKWHYYIGQVGARDVKHTESARMFVAGFPLAVTPGKVGEAMKGVWLNKASGVAIALGISVVVAERVSDGLAVLLLASLGVIAYPQYWLAFALILAVLLSVVILSQIRPVALWLLDAGERTSITRHFAASLRSFYEGSYLLFRPGVLLLAVGLGVISWLGEGLGMYLILLGLGVPPGWHTLSIAVFILSFSIVIGAASTLPGGLGASEVSIAGMLSLLLGLGTDVSAAATLLIRFATLWFGVSLGLCVWAFSRHLFGLGNDTAQQSGSS